MDKELKEMLDMELHRTTEIYGHYITRVPGGWIYTTDKGKAICFVPEPPLSEEEQERRKMARLQREAVINVTLPA